MMISLKGKEQTVKSLFSISPDGETYQFGDRYEIPVDVVKYGKEVEISKVVKLDNRMASIDGWGPKAVVMANCKYHIPIFALSDESKLKVMKQWPEMFI